MNRTPTNFVSETRQFSKMFFITSFAIIVIIAIWEWEFSIGNHHKIIFEVKSVREKDDPYMTWKACYDTIQLDIKDENVYSLGQCFRGI